jgi:glycosyltransferase involved in cell wall biosynthesis
MRRGYKSAVRRDVTPDPAALRVLQVIPMLAQGGMEIVASLLTVSLKGRVARIAVAAETGVDAKYGGAAIEQPLRDANIDLYYIARPRQHVWYLAEAALRLAFVLRRERPDVIHAHNPAAATAARIARAIAGPRGAAIVSTYHGVRPERLTAAVRALSLSSDVVVGVGPSATRMLQESGLPVDRTATVYNAVQANHPRSPADVRAEFGIPVDAEVVITVGRYEGEKNQALLLEALARLAPSRPQLYALIVGIGSLETDLRAQATRSGLADRVQITGPRNDALDLMAAADVFALTSTTEGLPLVLIEAMTAATAVVTTDVGGVRDVARDEETALLVPSQDSAQLASAIAKLLDDASLRARLSETALAFVSETCSFDTMVDEYLRVYVAAVERRRSRPSAFRAGASPSK